VRVVLADGEVLFRQGDRSDLIYEVDEGEIDLFRVDQDGTENHVVAKVRGEHFGEMGPMFHLPRSATARARGGAAVTGYSVAAFGERVGEAKLTHLVGAESANAVPAPAD
jgi:putative ABC transport system ATP-binding protein